MSSTVPTSLPAASTTCIPCCTWFRSVSMPHVFCRPQATLPEKLGTMPAVTWQTRRVGPEYDALAPDGSEIRLLVEVNGGSMVHCSLAPGAVTRAIRHRSVEEVWLCLAGRGQ